MHCKAIVKVRLSGHLQVIEFWKDPRSDPGNSIANRDVAVDSFRGSAFGPGLDDSSMSRYMSLMGQPAYESKK